MTPANSEPATAPVSVIVPSYNCGRFIAEAIDSVLAQTLQPEQIVIVDDGSTDDTRQVVGRYDDPRLQFIHQQNSGVAAARNTGLNAARCEYVTFLDAADRWQPAFIEIMHGFLADDPAAVCAFANFVRFPPAAGEALKDQFRYYPELRRPTLLRDAPNAFGRIPRERAFGALVACGDIPAYLQAMMFRRRVIETVRFDPSLALGSDIHFALQTFLLGGVIFTDEVLTEVRQRDGNARRNLGEIAVHTLHALKALARHVTRDVDVAAYRDRLIKAHIDAALDQTKLGRVGAGWRTYRDSFRVPGSPLRKFKGSARMALALAGGRAK
jgi:glycosyltransferase involved in cell wall biosynthesis